MHYPRFFLLFLFGWLLHGLAVAQTGPASATLATDTIRLQEVTVRGYESNRPLLETAASIGLLTRRDLQQRFGTPTLVPVLNTLPGVRIDERSPGSYRLSIRGSLIRSPFGVRNVKVYWNELPLTDAGGNTPLNALDVRTIGQVEVLKGPSGSLYGANTGGTVLFSSPAAPTGTGRQPQTSGITAEASGLIGSYGLGGNGLFVQTTGPHATVSVSYNHLQAYGYRDHSGLARDNLTLTGSLQAGTNRTLTVLGLYSDLFYQTPGGLTAAQYQMNRQQSRPATRLLPGSADQQAGIYQKFGYLGVGQTYRFDERWENTTVLYGSLTDFRNPFITNYERRADQGLGGRTVTRYRFAPTTRPTVLTFGGEYQRSFTVDRNYGNRRGQPDTLQTDDELRAITSVLFVQSETELPAGFILTAGLSRNDSRYGFTRFAIRQVTAQSGIGQTRRFAPVWLPRLALLKKLTSAVSVFGSVGTGYSAPTTQEVRPSEGTFNAGLNPERGTNVEVGLRGAVVNGRLRFDVVAYQFALRQTIVRRSADNGAEFFTNAGRTDQRGLEASIQFDLLRVSSDRASSASDRFFSRLSVWNALTLTNYRYENYRQGLTDVSGNRVPGVAPVTLVTGLDAETRMGLYAHLTYQFLTPFFLDDANTTQADPTRILTATAGFRRSLGRRWTTDAYVTGDNLLNQSYSLGYDLNAFGGRFYNAAAGRNVVAGLRIAVRW